MIYYSIIPYELIFNDDKNLTFEASTIQYSGCNIEVLNYNGIRKISRILSTSPKDFLNPKLQPGNTID